MKTKIFLPIIIYVCLSLSVSAQNKTHTIGVFVTPQVSILDYQHNMEAIFDIRLTKINGYGISFSEGVFYQAKYNKLGFSIGLGFTKINNIVHASFNVGDSILQSKVRAEKSFLSIPVSFFYDFYQKDKFSIGANAGLSIDYLTKSLQISDYNGADYYENRARFADFFNRINLSAFAGIDFKWTFSNGIGISVTPTCSYIFTNIIPFMRHGNTNYIVERYVNVGIAGKFFYTF